MTRFCLFKLEPQILKGTAPQTFNKTMIKRDVGMEDSGSAGHDVSSFRSHKLTKGLMRFWKTHTGIVHWEVRESEPTDVKAGPLFWFR